MAKKRVLIVDDEAPVRAGIREVLERSGYEPAEVENGLEALAQAAALGPDVILLNVWMRGLGGFEVCRRLKANPVTTPIPVIFLTKLEDVALDRLAYQAGGVACIPKPALRENLPGVIATVLATATREVKRKAGSEGDRQ